MREMYDTYNTQVSGHSRGDLNLAAQRHILQLDPGNLDCWKWTLHITSEVLMGGNIAFFEADVHAWRRS